MSTLKLPVLHEAFDAPVVLVPLAEILAGYSGDGIDFTGSGNGGWRSPQGKRDDYANGWGESSTGGANTWAEWLEILSTVGLRNPVQWDPREQRLGNGHHRVTAAMDLGWTHMPVVLSGSPECIGGVEQWKAWSVSDRPLPPRQRDMANA